MPWYNIVPIEDYKIVNLKFKDMVNLTYTYWVDYFISIRITVSVTQHYLSPNYSITKTVLENLFNFSWKSTAKGTLDFTGIRMTEQFFGNKILQSERN